MLNESVTKRGTSHLSRPAMQNTNGQVDVTATRAGEQANGQRTQPFARAAITSDIHKLVRTLLIVSDAQSSLSYHSI